MDEPRPGRSVGAEPPTDVSLAVLAGGGSRRMGGDKSRVVFDGVPLLRRAVELAGSVSDDVMVIAPADREIAADVLAGLAWRAVRDMRVAAGPMAGLEAALWGARHDRLVAIPVDMPRLIAPLLDLLARTLRDQPADCAALVSGGVVQPFPIGLQRRTAATVSSLLDADVRSLRALLRALSTSVVPEADWRRLDPEGAFLRNINTPADLATYPRL